MRLHLPPQDLCGCSRLVGLHCLLYTLIACLISNAEDDPDAEGRLPPGCLPALRLLRLRATEDDRHFVEGEPAWLPGELSAVTSLTSLHVEGPEVTVRTLSEWWDQVEPPSPGQAPDSEDLENDALSEHAQWVPSVELLGPYFCLPRLRELSLLSCGLEAVPEFVAGEGRKVGAALAGRLAPHLRAGVARRHATGHWNCPACLTHQVVCCSLAYLCRPA